MTIPVIGFIRNPQIPKFSLCQMLAAWFAHFLQTDVMETASRQPCCGQLGARLNGCVLRLPLLLLQLGEPIFSLLHKACGPCELFLVAAVSADFCQLIWNEVAFCHLVWNEVPLEQPRQGFCSPSSLAPPYRMFEWTLLSGADQVHLASQSTHLVGGLSRGIPRWDMVGQGCRDNKKQKETKYISTKRLFKAVVLQNGRGLAISCDRLSQCLHDFWLMLPTKWCSGLFWAL
jgi:hypothetical protein